MPIHDRSHQVHGAAIDGQIRHEDTDGLPWSQWHKVERIPELQAATEAEVGVTLHTDNGHISPRVGQVELVWE